MLLPNIEEIKEQKLVPEAPQEESETSQKTEETELASEETQKPAEEAEPDKPAATEVPASFQKRINELTFGKKSAEEKVAALERELQRFKQTPHPASEEEQRENQARDYLRKLITEVQEERQSEVKAREIAADKALEEEIANVAAVYSDFKEKEVLEVMEEFQITSVETAYKAWKKMSSQVEAAKTETKREIISKPKNPSAVKTSDDFSSKFSEDKIKGKSLWELAEEAKREAGLR